VTNSVNIDSQQAFAKAFGDALRDYLNGKMGQSQAARTLELFDENGNPKRSRLNSYFHDGTKGNRKGKRPLANAHVLFLACTRLGFSFDYGGYRIRATRLTEKQREQPLGQMAFSFEREFELVDKGGNVDVKVKRPPGRIEVHVSLDAEAS
jgi:hypothetical protein